jgi:uncharacterized protein YqeY
LQLKYICMSLVIIVNEEIKKAMLGKMEGRLRALRAIKSAILLAQTEKGATENLTEEKELAVLNKLAKQRRDSLEIYLKENRMDLASKEEEELAVILTFMPAQLSSDELKDKLKAIIAELGATSLADLGKVMGMASKLLSGKADGKAISEMAKQLLSA